MQVEVIADGQQVLEHEHQGFAAPQLMTHDNLLVNQLRDKQREATAGQPRFLTNTGINESLQTSQHTLQTIKQRSVVFHIKEDAWEYYPNM